MTVPSSIVARDLLPLHLTTYLALAVMATVGVAGQPATGSRVAAAGMCLGFGVVYGFGFRPGRTVRQLTAYVAAQTVLVSAALALPSDSYSAFSFLFYLLSLHVWLVFGGRTAVCWLVLFFMIAGAKVLAERGSEGILELLFNAGAYMVVGFMGRTLRQSELARRENERLLEELRHAQRQVQELAVAAERNRLARELHDSVKQQIFAVMMQLGAARVLFGPEAHPAQSRVAEAERLAQQAGAELSMLIHELRPIALGERELVEALREYVADWSRQTGIVTELTTDCIGPLPPAVEHGLLRITQEALANVARHSHAHAVGVVLQGGTRSIRLTIADDGQGFDAAAIRHGVGLASMHERMAALGGTIAVESAPGAGTTIATVWEGTDD